MRFGVYRRGWCLSSPVCPSTVQSTPLTIAFLALAHASDRTLTLTHIVVGALREVLLASIRPPLVCPISLLVVNLRRVARQICKLTPDPSGKHSRPANQLRLPAGVQKGIEAAQASGESGATLPTGQPEGQTARQRLEQPASQPDRQTDRQTTSQPRQTAKLPITHSTTQRPLLSYALLYLCLPSSDGIGRGVESRHTLGMESVRAVASGHASSRPSGQAHKHACKEASQTAKQSGAILSADPPPTSSAICLASLPDESPTTKPSCYIRLECLSPSRSITPLSCLCSHDEAREQTSMPASNRTGGEASNTQVNGQATPH